MNDLNNGAERIILKRNVRLFVLNGKHKKGGETLQLPAMIGREVFFVIW